MTPADRKRTLLGMAGVAVLVLGAAWISLTAREPEPSVEAARQPVHAAKTEEPRANSFPPDRDDPPRADAAEEPVLRAPAARSDVPPSPDISEPIESTLPTSRGRGREDAAVTELEEVQSAFRDFRNALGQNPVGTNVEITRALLGDNLKQVKLPVPAGSKLNAQGELCDRWSTPYFFHQISGQKMEVRSAGPDRQLWTADDRQR